MSGEVLQPNEIRAGNPVGRSWCDTVQGDVFRVKRLVSFNEATGSEGIWGICILIQKSYAKKHFVKYILVCCSPRALHSVLIPPFAYRPRPPQEYEGQVALSFQQVQADADWPERLTINAKFSTFLVGATKTIVSPMSTGFQTFLYFHPIHIIFNVLKCGFMLMMFKGFLRFLSWEDSAF